MWLHLYPQHLLSVMLSKLGNNRFWQEFITLVFKMGNIKVIHHQEVLVCLQKKLYHFSEDKKKTWQVPVIPVRMRFSNFVVPRTTNNSNRVNISHHLDIISSGIYSKQPKLTTLKWKALITAVDLECKINRKNIPSEVYFLRWIPFLDSKRLEKCGSGCFTQKTDVIRRNSLMFSWVCMEEVWVVKYLFSYLISPCFFNIADMVQRLFKEW